MKMDKSAVLSKTYYIVDEGFQMIPRHHYKFITVTETHAVMEDDSIFCTRTWFESLKNKTGLDLKEQPVNAKLQS